LREAFSYKTSLFATVRLDIENPSAFDRLLSNGIPFYLLNPVFVPFGTGPKIERVSLRFL